MSTTTPAELIVRPRAVWYLAVVVLWVAALVLVGTVVVSFVRIIDDGVSAVPESGQITVSAAGNTIYSSDPPVSRECFLEGSGGPIPVDGLSFDLNTSFNGIEYWALADTPKGLAPGTYVLSCPGVGAGAQLWVGDRLTFGSLVVRFLVACVAGFLGLVALIVLLVRRHSSKSKIRVQRLAATAGYGAGWPAPGWQGVPPANPYGQPPPPSGQGQPPGPYGQPPPPYDEQPPS